MADLEHANDRDLIGDTDARHWAQRFVRHVKAGIPIADDEGTMTAWFAGAIESGRMAAETTATRARSRDPRGRRGRGDSRGQCADRGSRPLPPGGDQGMDGCRRDGSGT